MLITAKNVSFFVLFVIVACKAQIPGFGGCPTVKPKENFEPKKFEGMWYESEKYLTLGQLTAKCTTENFAVRDTLATVEHKHVDTITNFNFSYVSSLSAIATPNEAKYDIFFDLAIIRIPVPYFILETDYTSYAMVYSCSDVGLFHSKSLSILTRERMPDDSILQMAYNALDTNGLDRSLLVKTDQKNC